jgi:hypothetical protein
MDTRDRDRALDYGHLAMHIAALIFVVFFAVLVVWLVVSKPNAKLFEADGVVCYSQPFQMECLKVR